VREAARAYADKQQAANTQAATKREVTA
jgi:hypothetical protein